MMSWGVDEIEGAFMLYGLCAALPGPLILARETYLATMETPGVIPPIAQSQRQQYAGDFRRLSA